jgi:hypothetical protein
MTLTEPHGNNRPDREAIWDRRSLSGRCYEARRNNRGRACPALSALPPDERGWITFGEARMLFSTKGDQYAFGETDDDGRKNIESFAAHHRVVFNLMPVEERLYFVKRNS